MEVSVAKRKERAKAFLITVGAKALVMSEKKESNADKIKQSIYEEQLAKNEMVLEADTRLLKREMSLPPGLQVVKCGDKDRKINIQFTVLSSGTYGIVYRSAFWGTAKEFDLSSLKEPEPVEGAAADVKLDNGRKVMQLRFSSEHQKDVFLYAISHIAHT